MPLGDGPFTGALADAAVAAFHDAHERLYGYCFRDRPGAAGRVGEPAGHRDRPDPPAPRCVGRRRGDRPAVRSGTAAGLLRRRAYVEHADLLAPSTCRPVPWWPGPAVIEEYGATVPLHPGFTATVDRSATWS